MKYLFSDYYFLCGAAAKDTRTVQDAYRVMCTYLGTSSTCACLLHALRGLAAEGFITVNPEIHGENQVINLGSAITVTEKGRKAVSISPLQKLFGERKAFVKNQLAFCSLDRPDTDIGKNWWIDGDCLAEINLDGIRRSEWNAPLFDLSDLGDGFLSLVLHRNSYNYEDDDNSDPDATEQTDRVMITGDRTRVMQGVSDLLSATHALLTQSPRTRKIAIHGVDKSLIVTLAQAAGEQGTCLRMTVAPIRFNRQRFYGKRDGDLDYAQCGDPLMTLELASPFGLASRLLPCAVARPDLLSEGDLEIIDAISKLFL